MLLCYSMCSVYDGVTLKHHPSVILNLFFGDWWKNNSNLLVKVYVTAWVSAGLERCVCVRVWGCEGFTLLQLRGVCECVLVDGADVSGSSLACRLAFNHLCPLLFADSFTSHRFSDVFNVSAVSAEGVNAKCSTLGALKHFWFHKTGSSHTPLFDAFYLWLNFNGTCLLNPFFLSPLSVSLSTHCFPLYSK